MKFKDNGHERYYNTFINKAKHVDIYRRALFYTLAVDKDTRANINSLYDFKSNCIIPEGLCEGFQTTASLKVTRMAFNLYNGDTTNGVLSSDDEGYGNDAENYAPDNLFDCCYAPYFWEAIQIRFPYLRNVEETEKLMDKIAKEVLAERREEE